MATEFAEEMRGQILALQTAIVIAFVDMAAVRAEYEGTGPAGASEYIESVARRLESSLEPAVAAVKAVGGHDLIKGYEYRTENMVFDLRNNTDIGGEPVTVE